jgi:hypothetical protein
MLVHGEKKLFVSQKKNTNSYLDTIVASRDATILDLDVGGWMCKFTFGVRSGALVPLELSADF